MPADLTTSAAANSATTTSRANNSDSNASANSMDTTTSTTPVEENRRYPKRVMKNQAQERDRRVRERVSNGDPSYLEIVDLGPVKGDGVVTTAHILAGEVVCEYAGELISRAESRQRHLRYALYPELKSYIFDFKYCEIPWSIDATNEMSIGRKINHSRTMPNCQVRVTYVDRPRLIIYALKDINEGEELSYDYGDRSANSLANFPWLAE